MGGVFLVACLPFTLAFDSAPISPTPFPAGRGRPRLFHARGFAPCIPGAGWDAALGLLVESGLWWGGLPSLSPAAPAFSLLCCPHPPNPLPRRGRGRLRLFHARGFAPCIPGAGRDAALGLPVESGVRRGGLTFFAACRPCPEPSLSFIPISRQEDRAQTIGLSQYSIFGKVLGGLGDSFKSPPAFSPAFSPSFPPSPRQMLSDGRGCGSVPAGA